MTKTESNPAAKLSYNRNMLGRASGVLAGLALLLTSAFGQPAPKHSLDEALWGRLQKSFAARDAAGFAAAFAPEIREREQMAAETFLDVCKMDRVLFRLAGRAKDSSGKEWLFVQVFYQNDISAMLETWRVLTVEDGGQWSIREKEISENVTTLYKLHLPAGRVLRGAHVEVRHEDIRMSFDDAWVYYDNIPDQETALIVLGEGRLRFEPSNAEEKHQLELRFGQTVLEDRLEAVFLRFSPSFFESNITITGGSVPPDSSEAKAKANRAYALFSKYNASSFTIENSLTDELLSFIPQDEQAVFDLETRRRGDLTYIYSPFSDEEIHLYSRTEDQLLNLYTPDAGGPGVSGKRSMFVSFNQTTNVRNYQIEVDFQPEKSYLSARARIDVTAQVDTINSLKFVFNPNLDIVRVYDAEGRELFHTQDRYRRLLYVYLLQPVEKGKSTAIEVFYRGVLEPPIPTADILPGGQYNPKISLTDDRFDSFLFSRSADWYPHPPEEDFYTATLRIIVPPGFFCVANGKLVEENKVDGVGRVTSLDKVGYPYFGYETKSPVKYLSFIVGRFIRVESGAGGPSPVPVEAWYSPELRFAPRGLVDDARSVLREYASLFGAYPFEKLTIVERTWPTAGGHSPASFIVLNASPRAQDTPVPSRSDSPVELTRWKEGVLAHEIAHQWWGQGVGAASYRDLWLSEGLAQFAAARYLKAKLGDNTYSGILKKFARWTRKKSKFGPIILGSRLSYLDFEAFQSIIYDKTALVLVMLMDVVGEDAFFRGLRDFFAAFKFKTARTADFRAALEKAAGRDLKPFFGPWFESHFLPEAVVSHAVSETGSGAVLTVHIRQTGPLFVFPLWMSWQENGKTIRRMLTVDAQARDFEIACSAHPSKIEFDPDGIFPGTLR